MSPDVDRGSLPTPRPSTRAGGRALATAGRKRRWLAAAAALVFAVVGLVIAVAPWLYSSSATISAVRSQLQNATGLYVAARAAPRLSLTPRPHIVMDGVVFADRNSALVVEAEQLYGVLKLLPLLSGRLEMDSLALVRPRARLDLDLKPVDAPGPIARAAAAQPGGAEAQKADSFRLGLLNIVDGALRVRRGGTDYVAEKIAASLEWRKVGEPALLTSAFDWRGERFQLVLWIARPGMLLRGDPSVATARLDGDGLKLEAQGVAQSGANARYAGRLAGAATSVRHALSLAGLETPLPGPFGDAQFSAQAIIGVREAALKELRVDVDGNAYEGELALRDVDGRLDVTAALKSDFVALKPMFAETPALVTPDGQWSREPFEPPNLAGADFDIRLSARRARLGRLAIEDADAAATLRDGVLDVSLVEAQAYHGRIKAHASLKPEGDGLAVHATAQTTGVDARALLWDAFGKQAIGGALDSTLTLDASGAAFADMMRSLNGRATLNLVDGEITGVDFERALRRFEKRPLSSAQDIRSGSSVVSKASATLRIENGVGALEDGAVSGPGFALSFAGTTNLAERSLAIKATAREADPSGKPRDKSMQIAFDLSGAWDELSLAPDPRSFIRRSGAAAPLLPEPPPTPEER